MRKLATFLDYSDVNIQCRASVSGMDSAMSVGVSGRAEVGCGRFIWQGLIRMLPLNHLLL